MAQNRDYVRKFIKADEKLVAKQAIEDALNAPMVGAVYNAKSGAFSIEVLHLFRTSAVRVRRTDNGAEFILLTRELAACYVEKY